MNPEHPNRTDPDSLIESAKSALDHYFGFRDFLDGQESVIQAILDQKDVLVVMPTGGGKSLCFQLPGIILPGVTVVVSPLIALMKDQVDSLLARNIRATLINSAISTLEQSERIDRLVRGEYDLVYVAPERFRSRAFVSALKQVKIGLFAVDEAHCLSQWGHDFRPDYLRLSAAIDALGNPQKAAFTATATEIVRDDILKHLQLRDPAVFVSGFSRPNLQLNIRNVDTKSEKFQWLTKVVSEQKTGIIYCATRKNVEEVACFLADSNIRSIGYHGGMSDEERVRAQNQYLQREADVAVATNAFGMGIDRSDVRFVIHFDVPGSVEAYYQEVGRAGRDGNPSVCELLFNYADTRTQEFFIDGNNPGIDKIRDVYEALRSEANSEFQVELSINDIAEKAGIRNTMAVGTSLGVLSRHGYVERFDIEGKRIRGSRLLQPTLSALHLDIDEKGLAEKDKRDREKLRSIIEFCYSTRCRPQWILDYFGEKNAEGCRNCDVCDKEASGEIRSPNSEEETIVRKVLSGVARMSIRQGDQWQGRFGRGRVIQMLTGSRSKEILNARLDSLSTYGILAELSPSYLQALYKEMEKVGLVESSKGEYPVVRLTDYGVEVMKSQTSFRLFWPELCPKHKKSASGKSKPKVSHSDSESDFEEIGFDQELFKKLKLVRLDIASKKGNLPVFRVFSNATLEMMVRLHPTTVDEGMAIPGVGPIKAETFLPEFLKVIRNHSG
ncbi:MAG TPA: ATP-dependent DNA helicase RecQ [Verrucomicrobiales bacterium]|nr:ATP-dependent DNA helicase RecQ [Verrucomicrobiales bacterium]HIL71617.1 ATP-dependent DNA helicase RecQ [Verrucomicrobiota bacterium]